MGCYRQFPMISNKSINSVMVNENIPAIFSQYQEKSNREIEPVKKEKRKLKIDKNNKKNSNKNNNNSSSKLSISPSLSSLLNQRKSQKLNNNSKKATHHYHKYEKYSSENDNSSDDSMDSIKKNCIKRRRSSSYWYNTNINNSNGNNNKFIHNSNNFFDNSFLEEEEEENSFDPLTTTSSFDNVYSNESKVIVETYSFSNETDATITCKIFSDLSDLDLITEYSLNDIDEFFAPKFDVKSKRTHYNNKRQTCFADIELDSIAESVEEEEEEEEQNNNKERELKNKENIIRKDKATMKNAVISSSVLPEMNKEIMQPHFMRLYAFEQNSKFKGSLPDLDIDESLLSKLSYKDIWTLEVPTATKKTETNDNSNACLKSLTEELKIKLALMTRKKLWCDMIVQVSKRQQPIDKKELLMITKNSEELVNSNISINNDSNNKNSENNNLIALNAHQFAHIGYEHNNNNNRIKTTSLLRLKDGPLPWNTKAKSDLFNKGMTIKNTSFMNDNVIKPFGVLPNSKKTQYVVKGWVDKRFF